MEKDLRTRINAVCAYYTMYPLSFPHGILKKRAQENEWVLDPFCGRGTTNFAARLLGLPSVGIDSSPIAVAIAKAKLSTTTPKRVVRTCREILHASKKPKDVPDGEFWVRAYHKKTLEDLCKLREAIMEDCNSESRIALRAIILGALHGPLTKGMPSYFSNQCLRTFSPKPAYAAQFWKTRKLKPKYVDGAALVARKASYYLSENPPKVDGVILEGDSTSREAFTLQQKFSWVITSPPYYGMRTYVQDQWLRSWFLGGPPQVPYGTTYGLTHESPERFISQLTKVWHNAEKVCIPGGRLICRFGGINTRNQDSLSLIKRSFHNTAWRIITLRSAGSAHDGNRQASQFGNRIKLAARTEHDIYARLES